MLVKNLGHNLKYLKDCEVIVVNDDPTTSVRNELKALPVTLIENRKNLGFAGAVNAGVDKASGEFVLLLNTDVVLKDDYWKKAVDLMKKNPEVFAISFAQDEKDGSTVGKNTFFWSNGFFMHKKAPDLQVGRNGWAEGGSCLIRKTYFDGLGGFDEIFSPFYWEDIDLSYRAWKAGYMVLFEPSIRVEHHHESTIGKYFDKKRIEQIATRNQFIFTWKNMERELLMTHVLRLPLFLSVTAVNPATGLGFLAALLRLPAIMQKRRRQKAFYKRSDRQILDLFKQ